MTDLHKTYCGRGERCTCDRIDNCAMEVRKPRLNPEDIIVDTYRTGASGGVQLSGRSGVRVTHVATGDSVALYGPGSQLKLKALAIETLTKVVLG